MQGNIGLDLDSIPENISTFIRSELTKCQAHGIPINMPRTKVVYSKGMRCAGFFEDDPLEFSVAIGKALRSWLPTFVHESCHMDQWIERIEPWTRRIDGKEPMKMFDQWLQGNLELDADALHQVITTLVDIESDCERRSVEKIKQNGLPIKLDTYIRKSNAYIWSYRIMQETRNWDHSGAYDYRAVWGKMKPEFYDDYTKLPKDIRKCFMEQILMLER